MPLLSPNYGVIGGLTFAPIDPNAAPVAGAAPAASTGGSSGYQLSGNAANLLGPNAATAANSLYSNPNVDPQHASQAVNDLFGAGMQAAQDTAQGQAQGIIAQGDEAEANAYLSAGAVADQNARIARASAGIQAAQEDRQVARSLATQGADIAGAGFGGGTSAMALFADSAHQGALGNQLITAQGELNAGGFEQQSLAAQAEADAARTAAEAAGVLGGQDFQTAADLQTNALNSASFLAANASNTATHPVTGAPLASGGGGGGTPGVRVIDDPQIAKTEKRNEAINAANARADAAYNDIIESPTYGAGPSISNPGGAAINNGVRSGPGGKTGGVALEPTGNGAKFPATSGGGAAGDVSGVVETPLAVDTTETSL